MKADYPEPLARGNGYDSPNVFLTQGQHHLFVAGWGGGDFTH
jgi:hypothetical protein